MLDEDCFVFVWVHRAFFSGSSGPSLEPLLLRVPVTDRALDTVVLTVMFVARYILVADALFGFRCQEKRLFTPSRQRPTLPSDVRDSFGHAWQAGRCL